MKSYTCAVGGYKTGGSKILQILSYEHSAKEKPSHNIFSVHWKICNFRLGLLFSQKRKSYWSQTKFILGKKKQLYQRNGNIPGLIHLRLVWLFDKCHESLKSYQKPCGFRGMQWYFSLLLWWTCSSIFSWVLRICTRYQPSNTRAISPERGANVGLSYFEELISTTALYLQSNSTDRVGMYLPNSESWYICSSSSALLQSPNRYYYFVCPKCLFTSLKFSALYQCVSTAFLCECAKQVVTNAIYVFSKEGPKCDSVMIVSPV